jgi:ADP-heptose:LPS heptosyltransferase
LFYPETVGQHLRAQGYLSKKAEFEEVSGLIGLRRLLKRLTYLPLSPRVFVSIVSTLRTVGVLREPKRSRGTLIRRIFISHPFSSIGDLALLLPFLETVIKQWPEAHVDIAVGTNSSTLLGGVRGLNCIFLCGPHTSSHPVWGYYARILRYILIFKKQIMGYDYDLAIVPRWGSILRSEAVYLAYLTGAPERVGYSAVVDGGDIASDRLLTKTVIGGLNEHELLRNLRLLSRAGLTAETFSDESIVRRPIDSLASLANMAEKEVDSLIASTNSGKRQYAVVAPGATAPFRMWSTNQLVAAMREINRKSGFFFYVIGAESDRARCEKIAEELADFAVSIAGTISLRKLVALIAKAELFLGMDSGPAHIAGGLGIPTIVVSPFPSTWTEDHPNSPMRFRPCGPHVRVLQPSKPLPPCFPTCAVDEPHCIKQVSVGEVVLATAELVEEHQSAGSHLPVSNE